MGDIWSPPQAEVQDPGVTGDEHAVAVRRHYLYHEASVRSIGSLYYFVAILFIVSGIVGVAGEGGSAAAVAFVLLAGLAAIQFWTGRALRTLKPWARIPAGIFSVIGLLGFPIGTLINGYILYLLFSAKGNTVFSEAYRQVIAQTPDIKYRTSIVVWIVLSLLALVLAATFILPKITGH